MGGEVGGEEVVDEGGADDAAGAEAREGVARQRLEAVVLGGPDAEGQAEAVFLLGDDGVGQEAAQRLLEEPAQGEALQLPLRRDAGGEGEEFVRQQRERDIHAGELGGADDLGQVVVGEGVFPVVGQHAVDQAVGVRGLPGVALLHERALLVHAREEVGFEEVLHAEAQHHVVHLHAVGHGHARLLDVARALLDERDAVHAG